MGVVFCIVSGAYLLTNPKSAEIAAEKYSDEEAPLEDIHSKPIIRFMMIPWNDIEARNLSVPEGVPILDEIICIGELPEYQIKLYGYNDEEYTGEGVAIQIGEDVNYFDWTYLSPRISYPSVYWKEAEQQLQVSLKAISGTELSAQELHVLQRYDTGTLLDSTFTMDEYSILSEKQIGFEYDEKMQTLNIVNLFDYKQLAKIKILDEEMEVERLELGNISWFVLGETIMLRVVPGYYLVGRNPAVYEDMPTLEAPVIMERNGENLEFRLGSFQLVNESEKDGFF